MKPGALVPFFFVPSQFSAGNSQCFYQNPFGFAFFPKSFDSYLITEENLVAKTAKNPEGRMLRLLEVDNRLIIPWNEHLRFLISSADVLHSWSVPSLGIKMDACPGRLNQVSVFVTRPGVFYGQCSEICGVNHAFMPICLETP